MDPNILSAPQVAKLLGVTPATVTTWCVSGKLRAFRPGVRGRWKIHREDLEKFINYNQEVQEAQRSPKSKGLALVG